MPTSYDTASAVIGNLTVTLSKEKGVGSTAFDRVVAALKFLGERIVDPGFGAGDPDSPDQGLPGGRPDRPDQGLPPGSARPDQDLPGRANRPDQGLPPSGARPDQGLPSSGARPDQGLPSDQPGADQGLPGQGGRPSQGLPGSQPGAGNQVPGEALGKFLQENAAELAKVILKGTACDPAQPKK